MAFDGFFIYKHVHYLSEVLVGSRIDKIYQIGSSDIVMVLKGKKPSLLLISVQSSQPRITLIKNKPEAPTNPPMFCMLLRKYIQSGIITGIEQKGLERIVNININAHNQIGDLVSLNLIIEIMGKHSNIILTNSEGIILDSIKHIGPSQSSRIIGSGKHYTLPPSQKIKTLEMTLNDFKKTITEAEKTIQKYLYRAFEGISPSLSTSICKRATIMPTTLCSILTDEDIKRLWQALQDAIAQLKNKTMWIYTSDQIVDELSAVPLKQFEALNPIVENEAYLPYLNAYYDSRKDTNRLSQKSASAIKQTEVIISKLANKINNLQGDIDSAKNLDTYKLYGELLTAHLHQIKKGMAHVDVLNYYDGTSIQIPLDITKSPNENAQRYYKRYNKAKVTLEVARSQIDIAKDEISYLKQVRTLLEHAEAPEDIEQLTDELVASGFIKRRRKQKNKKSKKLPPLHYKSSEGVDILVGRNNYQNDELTLKKAHKEHIWLHTKDIAGSHVIICAEFKDIEEETIEEAAIIAAYHSDGRHSSQVPVDLTEVKFVKKPRGAKPGMVIYVDNKTMYVNPKEEVIKTLRVVD